MKLARIAVAVFLFSAATSPAAPTQRQAILNDVQKTLGSVPGFLKAMPDPVLPGAWKELKDLEMSARTALPPKYKELIGLAVAAQIPCHYCIYAHTEFAKTHGATEAELGQAIGEAGATRQWSAFVNGAQIDHAQFKQDLAAMVKQVKAAKTAPKPAQAEAPIDVVDAESAYKDMERTLGMVPDFMRRFPANAIAGAWLTMKNVEMNPASTIPPKYTALMGLAVAAQEPCTYCIEAHTEIARAHGATDAEVLEAVAMAAHTRNMSTLLNGLQYDMAAFKSDVQKMTAKGKTASR